MSSVQEERIAVEKLVARMDILEAGFDRIAERPQLLSSPRLSASRRRPTDAVEQVFQKLAEQLHEGLANKEKLIQQERTALQAEIHQLHKDLQDAQNTSHSERERADVLERDMHQAKAQIESEVEARRILERRNLELSENLEKERQSRILALSDAAEQTRAVEVMRQELSQVHLQAEEMKALEAGNTSKVAQFVNEQEARARRGNLEIQIQTARTEDVNRALKETNTEKDTEHQFSEDKAQLEDTERQLKVARSQTELANAVAIRLREELQRIEHELQEARDVERILRNDLTVRQACQSDYEHRLESEGRLVAQMLDVAIAFRNSHCKAHFLVNGVTSHPTIPSKQVQSLIESALTPAQQHRPSVGAQTEEPCPIDPSDPLGALESLRAFDHNQFLEAVAKTGSIIRKWQKRCKEYREHAKDKISFRNFAKGDLALFLPTRNSSKPWAAFNVSFPHYFLSTTGFLAEQLKTREWIVARITSITEHVVDIKDPSSNPHGLGDGVKYYMLEVEDQTQALHQGQTNKRDPETERKADSD